MFDPLDEHLLKWYCQYKGNKSGNPRTWMPFHDRLSDCLTQWLMGWLPDGKRNLAVCIPPRHGKTLMARDVIELGLGMYPDSEWIYTSYSAQLAVAQTMRVRAVLDTPWYRELFGPTGPGDTDGRQDYFRTARGGAVYGVGALGSITGFGAGRKRSLFGGGIVIDDPLKAGEARSDTVRERVNEWYTETLLSRRNAGAHTPILLIAQRLHQHDLVGYLHEQYAQDWLLLSLPALPDENADTIWPETFGRAEALKLREVNPYIFYSQYQQQPTTPGGALIKEEWWERYIDPEKAAKRCDVLIMTADTAYGIKEANDYSVFQLWGYENCRRAYLLDQMRGKWQYQDLLRVAVRFWQKHRGGRNPVFRLYIEDKASGQSMLQQYDLFREYEINAFPWSAGGLDKVMRVKQCLAAIYSGNVLIPARGSTPWVDDFVAECSAFSEQMSHAHDDQVDAMTMGVLIWRNQMGGMSTRVG